MIRRNIMFAVLCVFLIAPAALSEEIRIVDARGLTKSVKIVNAPTDVTVRLESPGQGVCQATNVDGIAEDKTASVEGGACVFSKLPPGTWQVKTPGGSKWSAKIGS